MLITNIALLCIVEELVVGLEVDTVEGELDALPGYVDEAADGVPGHPARQLPHALRDSVVPHQLPASNGEKYKTKTL